MFHAVLILRTVETEKKKRGKKNTYDEKNISNGM